MGLRVVAGTARGRRLEVPATEVRPTADRVREALFNALGSLGELDGAGVLDLYAGSGALGIEALSRGAAHATFVERDRSVAAVLRANVAACGFEDRATVVLADVAAHLAGAGSAGGSRPGLVLADPPYALDRWAEDLGALGRVAPGALVVAESDRPVPPPPGAGILRERRYGGTVVTLIRLAAPAPAPDPPEG